LVLAETPVASGGETAATAGANQRRYALHAGLGFLTLASLGLMHEAWRIRGTESGVQRQLRSTSDPLSTAVLALEEEASEGTTFRSAMNTSRCVRFDGTPGKGSKPRIVGCSEGKAQPTRFLFPDGNKGPIKLAEDPTLCLDAPGSGQLQLWSCTASSDHLDFSFHSEPPGWIGIPHFDHPDSDDAEDMDASDVDAVIKRVKELGYAGFSVFNGKAYIKKAKNMEMKDLKYMGTKDPCVFYLQRDHSDDVSIRLAAHPDTCMLAPAAPDGAFVGMAPCKGERKGTNQGAWTAGMIFRVKGYMHANTVDDGNKKESTTTHAPTTVASPRPSPAPVTSKAPPSTTPAPAPEEQKEKPSTHEDEGSEESTTAEPSEPVGGEGTTSRLIILLNVENVDYNKLQLHQTLETKFKNVIQDDLSTMAGLARDDVLVELRAGSVQAINTLTVPETSSADDVRSKLKFDELNEKVANHIRSVESIEEVAHGNITVQSYENKDSGSKSGLTILKLPLVVLLGIVVLAGVLACTVITVVRSKSKRDVAPGKKAAPAASNKEELLEDADPVSPGAVDGLGESRGYDDSPNENDRLLGEQNGIDETVRLEEQEKQEEFNGPGEEETPTGGHDPPDAAATATANSEEDDIKAAIAASLQDPKHGHDDDANNPFAADTTAVPGANVGY